MSGIFSVHYYATKGLRRLSVLLFCLFLLRVINPAYGQTKNILPNTDQVFLVCQGDTVFITVDTSKNTTPVAYYEWYHNGNLFETSTLPRIAVKDTGIYTATSHTSNNNGGCGSLVSNRIIVRWKGLVAKDDIFYTDPNTRVLIPYLLNDNLACTLPNGVTTSIVRHPGKGQLFAGPEKGIYIYQPEKNFIGVDSFFYSIKDANNGDRMSTARVLIYVGHDAERWTAFENDKNATIIYPNPVIGNFLYIKGDMKEIQEIMLIDDRGRRLYNSIPKLDITAIDMRRYAAAVYFIQVTYKDGTTKYFKVSKPK